MPPDKEREEGKWDANSNSKDGSAAKKGEQRKPVTEQTHWWKPKTSRKEQNQATIDCPSIFAPQAEEMINTAQASDLVFQFADLQDWRQVALRVLASIKWEVSCVYVDTLYPCKIEENPANWDKIASRTEEKTTTSKETEKADEMVISVGHWHHKQMAMATTIIKQNGQTLHCANHILGQIRGEKSEMHAAQAYMVGMEPAWNCYKRAQEGTQHTSQSHHMIIYTSYEMMLNPLQRERWKLYGSPNPPAPDQHRLNEVLTKWTRAPGMRTLEHRCIQERRGELDPLYEKWKIKIDDLLEQGKITTTELPPMPMTQEEVKMTLRSKQDKDEAEAIKFLADSTTTSSVASRIYRKWNLNRQVIKDCHVAMAHSRSLQTTFNNIVGATRFKVFEGSHLRKARCQKTGCGMIDSWEHFCTCYEVPEIGHLPQKERVEEIIKVCRRAEVYNPTRPQPSAEIYGNPMQLEEEECCEWRWERSGIAEREEAVSDAGTSTREKATGQ